MHFNIASRILNETLGANHKMVSAYAEKVQDILNKEAGVDWNQSGSNQSKRKNWWIS